MRHCKLYRNGSILLSGVIVFLSIALFSNNDASAFLFKKKKPVVVTPIRYYSDDENAALRDHECRSICVKERGATETAEVARIKRCLSCLSREPIEEEKGLYRWGEINQLRDMMVLPKEDFYTKLFYTQNKREQLINRVRLKEGYGTTKKTPEFLNCIKDNTCSAQLKEQRKKYLDLEDLFVYMNFDMDTKRVVYEMLAWEKLYPGFIDHYELSPEKELKQLEKTRSIPEYSRYQHAGELLGAKIFVVYTKKKIRVPSYMSYGMGAYWGMNPFKSLEHYEDKYGGIACPISGKIILDLDFERPEGMLNLRLLYESKIIHGYGGSGLKEFEGVQNEHDIYSPTGYNKFTNPQAFEAAAERFIIRFTSTSGTSLVSKANSVDIQRTCKETRIKDMLVFKDQCDLILMFFDDGMKKVGLLDFLVQEQSRDPISEEGLSQLRELINMGNKCLNSQTGNWPTRGCFKLGWVKATMDSKIIDDEIRDEVKKTLQPSFTKCNIR
jgi:hypothetical protein